MSALPIATTLPPAEDLAPYRAISRSAVISAVLAAISLPLVVLAVVSTRFQVGDAVPLGFVGAFLAAIAFIMGIIGARTVRRYPTEYTGGRLAKSGMLGGVFLAIIGSTS